MRHSRADLQSSSTYGRIAFTTILGVVFGAVFGILIPLVFPSPPLYLRYEYLIGGAIGLASGLVGVVALRGAFLKLASFVAPVSCAVLALSILCNIGHPSADVRLITVVAAPALATGLIAGFRKESRAGVFAGIIGGIVGTIAALMAFLAINKLVDASSLRRSAMSVELIAYIGMGTGLLQLSVSSALSFVSDPDEDEAQD
jgi:hypothetical protein